MNNPQTVAFHRPYLSGKEERALTQVMESGRYGSEGQFLESCADQLRVMSGAGAVLLTPSCTAALEMAALLCDIAPGDEVIMPSFTFVSSANPFVLRGARVVFADVDPRTMNFDPACAAAAVTGRTRAVVLTHYGGIAADLRAFRQLAEEHNLWLVEDAAHGIGAFWQDRHLGTVGHLGALSFHASKNLHCAEGGALFINDPRLLERAELLYHKGTNRRQFLNGEASRYTWVDVGSSFTLSEINAAFLSAQLPDLELVNNRRRQIWDLYRQELTALEGAGRLELAVPATGAVHNAHVFYVKCRDLAERENLRLFLQKNGIDSRFHYIPLHSAPAGQRFGRFAGADRYTTRDSERLLRLPLHTGLDETDIQRTISTIHRFFQHR